MAGVIELIEAMSDVWRDGGVMGELIEAMSDVWRDGGTY